MHQPQDGLVPFFTNDHRHCDALWAAFETACSASQEEALAAWELFNKSSRAHFSMEEEVLFPEFENQTGLVNGPTQVMRMEHQRMRGLLDEIGVCVEKGDLEEALDQGDTLLLFTGQHNQKEEAMLYPMADQALSPHWSRIAKALEEKNSFGSAG